MVGVPFRAAPASRRKLDRPLADTRQCPDAPRCCVPARYRTGGQAAHSISIRQPCSVARRPALHQLAPPLGILAQLGRGFGNPRDQAGVGVGGGTEAIVSLHGLQQGGGKWMMGWREPQRADCSLCGVLMCLTI